MVAVGSYLLTRLSEASTWAGLGTLLLAVHVSVDPGLLGSITMAGTSISGLLSYLLAEKSGK